MQTGEYVEVAGPDGAGTLRAGFVVGCDGEESTVRACARFAVQGREADKELLCADVAGIDVPDRRFERFAGGLAVAARRPDGITRLMVHAFGRGAARRTQAPAFDEVVAEWRHVTGEDVGAGTPVWLHAFGDATRLVEQYRIDRVLLAGDAAHQQLPSGGQALNLGLQDAVNLGWKLAAEVGGRAPEGLLDTYHDERHEIARLVQRNVEAQTQLLLGAQDVDATRAVLGELIAAPRGADPARRHDRRARRPLRAADPEHPLLGARLPHGEFETESGRAHVAALLRGGRGVLIHRSPGACEAAAPWADRVDVIRPSHPDAGPVPGVEGVLVRPDGHVAWIASTGIDVEAALRRWFGRPARSTPERDTQATTVPRTDSPESKERGAHVNKKVMVMSDTNESAPAQECDVVILGSGLAGSVSGSILARQGADVVLIDAGQHPRFAVGESMTPQLVEWLHILADRYDVPEIRHLLDVKGITKHITATHGRKQHFGFIRHEPGKEPDPREANMFVIPSILTESCHLYRQDTDSYFFHVAARYGCTTRQNWRAVDLDFDEDGVTVTGHSGEKFRAKYLIDASGFRSPLAQKLDLREQPARFKHHSRSLFTHYIGIKPFDEVSHHPASLRPPALWHGGTLHHVIERGWFWIIPFDNHKDSMNPLCSVGLTFDERKYPKPTDMTPDEEFHHYLDMYPAVKRQFAGASRVREWVSTDRLQYSSKHSIGYRWCLMSHAAGFIDPLFSRGLSNTFEVVDALASRILDSLKDDNWSVERYEYVDRLERGLLQYNDDLVNSSFISFGHFRLWNAVFRVWASFITPGTLRLTGARLNFALDRDDKHFRDLENNPYPGLWWPNSPDLKNILEPTRSSARSTRSASSTRTPPRTPSSRCCATATS